MDCCEQGFCEVLFLDLTIGYFHHIEKSLVLSLEEKNAQMAGENFHTKIWIFWPNQRKNSLYLLYTSGQKAESFVTNILISANFDIGTQMLSISLFTLKCGIPDCFRNYT